MPFSSYVFDLDGVLRDGEKPIPAFHSMMQTLSKNFLLIILTERADNTRGEICAWLKDRQVRYDHLYMRPRTHMGKAIDYKLETLKSLESGGFYVHGYFEDDNITAKRAREAGFPAIHVDAGWNNGRIQGENLGW